jgi:hypothetical protein
MPIQAEVSICHRGEKLDWFLKRVPVIWMFLTVVIIAAVLHSVYESGGF